MDWVHECALAQQFAVALASRNGVSNVGAAKAQGEDIANTAFELAHAFKLVEAKRTEDVVAEAKVAAKKK